MQETINKNVWKKFAFKLYSARQLEELLILSDIQHNKSIKRTGTHTCCAWKTLILKLVSWSMVANVETGEFSYNIQNLAMQMKRLYINTILACSK